MVKQRDDVYSEPFSTPERYGPDVPRLEGLPDAMITQALLTYLRSSANLF